VLFAVLLAQLVSPQLGFHIPAKPHQQIQEIDGGSNEEELWNPCNGNFGFNLSSLCVLKLITG
jgi:hypothetical protein